MSQGLWITGDDRPGFHTDFPGSYGFTKHSKGFGIGLNATAQPWCGQDKKTTSNISLTVGSSNDTFSQDVADSENMHKQETQNESAANFIHFSTWLFLIYIFF